MASTLPPDTKEARIEKKRKKEGGGSEKGYTVVAENIEMIPVAKQVAYCRTCATRKGEKTPLDATKSMLVKMNKRNSYAIIGPCSKCGRKRCCYVSKPVTHDE